MFRLRTATIAKELGIKNLYSHLRKHGISRYHATEIGQGRLTHFETALLYKLCRAFKCPLNDLFQYVPASEEERQQQYYLEPMINESTPMDVNQKLQGLDTEKRKQLVEFLERL